ncbi:MAG: sensor histidine kinase, partial [Chloroflexota bacterium]
THGGSAGSSSDVLAAAEVYNQGRSSRFVVLDVPEFAYSSRLFGALLAVFGVSTIILILATSLPVLALSFLFSYLVARNLTRRLESVSRVTTAIASGDLGERAPVQSRNEIGTLAENVNSMADHLETTMGALSEARTRAVDALRSRQELVASISHELRTPLAIMKAHLETVSTPHAVAAGALPSSEPCEVAVPAATLRALEGETQRLSGLIEDLFSLSRADAGALQITREAVDVAALLVDIAANLGPLAWAEGSVRLSVEIEPQLPRAVADAARVRQIVANLVRNAVRHTPQGGIIVLSASLHDRWMVVCVADTGEGIAADHMPHIFDPFYRVDEARSRESGGTGLGLAIVDELVELMGGRVTVESTVGEGSVFRVFLPVEGVTA